VSSGSSVRSCDSRRSANGPDAGGDVSLYSRKPPHHDTADGRTPKFRLEADLANSASRLRYANHVERRTPRYCWAGVSATSGRFNDAYRGLHGASSSSTPTRRGSTGIAGIATSRSEVRSRDAADLRKRRSSSPASPDEIEPDGAPNRAGIPRSTLQSNIWYHLGLAQYLSGDFNAALASYREGMKVSRVNDDMLVATSDWLVHDTPSTQARRRSATGAGADPRSDGHPREHRLPRAAADVQRRALGRLGAQPQHRRRCADCDAGIWRRQLVSWSTAISRKAREIFERVVAGNAWQAFGWIAAEADLKRGF
jgi:hypothetical protein